MFKPIPDIEEPKFYDEKAYIDSKLVLLNDGEFFDVKMQYPLLKMENAVSSCYVRYEVFEKLKTAQNNLPDGYSLRIWDGWRPFALQQELYEKYSQKIIEQFNLTDASFEEKQEVIKKFVSIPKKDENSPIVHATGGAVDVTLLKDGKEVFMGTAFDAFTDKTKTSYFEGNDENFEVRENRRILYNAMVSAGFTNLPSEWWHYDFGNKFWAYYNKKPAIYAGIFE